MSEPLLRTDPCPCNSGKQYKDCHLRKAFNPKEGFYVKVRSVAPSTHLERPKGTDQWVEKPGRMSVRVGYTETCNPDIENLLFILKERVTRLKHKMYGVKYHLDNFIDEEEKKSVDFNAAYKAPNHDLTVHDPRLVYEIESFLFQIKSGLDILSQIISMIYNLRLGDTYPSEDSELIRRLSQTKVSK